MRIQSRDHALAAMGGQPLSRHSLRFGSARSWRRLPGHPLIMGRALFQRRPLPRKSLLQSLLMALLLCLSAGHAVSQEQYRARLSPVPATLGNYLEVRGEGELTARLEGNTLHISGSFEGMSSAPASAHLHQGRRGIAGPPAHVLELEPPASEDAPGAGQVSASLRLDDGEVETLRSEGFYVQIHSENNPEGELRGWLLPSNNNKNRR